MIQAAVNSGFFLVYRCGRTPRTWRHAPELRSFAAFPMLFLKRIAAIVIAAALGLLFVYSAWAKLVPVIETFEMSFVETGLANWYTAPVLARLLIGLEFFIGLLLMASYNLRRFTLPVTIGLLLFFILYLLIQVARSGNEGNCGCFGEHIRMTPMMAVTKNLFMILGCLCLYLLPAGWRARRNALITILAALPCAVLPFAINPIDYTYTSNNLEEKVGYPLDLDLLYAPADPAKVEIPSVDLRRGRHVLSFLSLTCRHCRIAAKKMRLIAARNPAISFYFVLNGEEKDYQDFIDETGASNIPSSYCLGKSFVQLASAHLPRIYYIDNGTVVKKVDYFELNEYAIERWIETGDPGR